MAGGAILLLFAVPIAQLFKVRTLLDGRHYLAFYRVRCWAQRTFPDAAPQPRTAVLLLLTLLTLCEKKIRARRRISAGPVGFRW